MGQLLSCSSQQVSTGRQQIAAQDLHVVNLSSPKNIITMATVRPVAHRICLILAPGGLALEAGMSTAWALPAG